MKAKIRITESELHELINESIRHVLTERYGCDYDECYYDEPSTSNIEVDLLEILWVVMDSIGIDGEEYETTFDLLEKEMPVVEFEPEFEYIEPDYSVGQSGGWLVDSIKMQTDYKEYLDEIFQKGLIPQECYKPLFKKLEKEAYSIAEDRTH